MSKEEINPKIHEGVDKTQKILALQEELLNVRKEMSKKQSQWQKQRATLLSKNEIANIQIIELKQRIANFVKINETLTNAMTNQQDMNSVENGQMKSRRMLTIMTGQDADESQAEYANQTTNFDSQGKREKYQEQIRRVNKVLEEKDFQIRNLSKLGNQLRSKIEERNLLVSNLEETVYHLKCKIQKKEQQILRTHKQVQELEEKLEQNNQYIDETRRKSSLANKKFLNIQQLEQPIEFGRKYSKNSSYLIMKPTPDHSSCEIDNNSSYINQIQASQPQQNSEDQEKLLCEICSRVFSFGDFQEHAKYCGYKAQKNSQINTRLLFQKKREIEDKLERIRQQEQKENIKNRYYKNQNCFEISDNKSNQDKINQIREIAKGLNANRREYKKNSYTDFSIKSNAYYH